MKIGIFLSLVCFAASTEAALAGELIIGGQAMAPGDPARASTIGVFSPSATGTTGSLCTGTLIKKDIALTAAHCIQPGSKPVLIFNRNLRAPGAARRVAENVAVNSTWRGNASQGMDQGDIALVKFGGPLPEGYHAVPTAAAGTAFPRGEKVTLAGYGISNAKRKTGAGRLREAQVQVLNGRPGRSEMILDQSHGHGACHGDSGGPAYVKSGGRIVLAGLTNRSYPDSAPDDCAHDVVYTKVPAYQSWIRKNERKLEKRPASGTQGERRTLRLPSARAHLHALNRPHGSTRRVKLANR